MSLVMPADGRKLGVTRPDRDDDVPSSQCPSHEVDVLAMARVPWFERDEGG